MSGIVGAFSPRATERPLASSMLDGCAARGEASQRQVRQDRGSFLGVTRFPWELATDFSGPVLLVEDGELTIAADASLYYRDDLRARLGATGIAPSGSTPSHLILAAFRAWGAACVDRLEGDFAFVIWNRLSGELFAARDFIGRRPLYFAELNGTLVLGSTVGAVLAHPSCSAELNPAAIGAVASGLLWSAGIDTVYRQVHVLRAGHRMHWAPGAAAKVERYWEPAVRTGAPVSSFEAGAEELRALLIRATAERMASSGPTSVWMSGGWDSTSVFGAGQAALQAGANGPLLPVSISYPVGDPGHEDGLITSVAGFWKTPVHWLQINDIPLLEEVEERAAGATTPPAHLYEPWNRALAQGSRAVGARIALDGNGGDQLFQVSDIYLSDLLKQGRLLELRRAWQLKRQRGLRYLFRMTVEPLLPAALRRMTAPVSRSQNRHYLERGIPSWFNLDWVARQGLVERDRAVLPTQRAWRRADAETRNYLSAPYWSYASSYMTGALLKEGVETRGPLIDRRVVEFALRRPPEERSSGNETKRLLRQAMTGLLPAEVLAPRTHRTGLTTGYSRREMRAHLPALYEQVFSAPLALAELGAVDPARLRQAVESYKQGNEMERMSLYDTLNAELWLRHKLPGRRHERPVARELMAATA
ncbi:MAG TPA: asparagine synthase-related protein [Gemmatimonadales bacterium]|nr:asparagine synthase-related protein [Gemmatimonadales bacterium]